MTVPRRVFVISDLHLGGASDRENSLARGFRIFTHGVDLASFIRTVHDSKGARSVELVINGDLIDFLAEVDGHTGAWTPLKEPSDAERILQRITWSDSERMVFDSLADFLGAGHRLTLLLGNHDIELAYPSVRRALEQRLHTTGKDFHFIYDGEAYVIGDVIIEHGNRYDCFNTIDHDALRRIRSLRSRRIVPSPELAFHAPPGSDLVAYTINPLKERYPFLDLLKPEGETVPLLLALEPSCRRDIARVAALGHRTRRHRMRMPLVPSNEGDICSTASQSFFATEADLGGRVPRSEAIDPLEALLGDMLGQEGLAEFLDDLSDSDGHYQSESAIDISSYRWDAAERALGLLQLLCQKESLGLRKRLPALLRAIRTLPNSQAQAFDKAIEPPGTYLDAARDLAGNGFSVVVFGHTHLARDVRLGNARYINTGTWADILRLPCEHISAPRDHALQWLTEFVEALRDRSSFEAALAHGVLQGHLLFRPTYARLDFDDDDRLLDAELCEFDIVQR